MSVWMAEGALSHAAVAAQVETKGFALEFDLPWTNFWRSTQWGRGDERVVFEVDGRTGAGVLQSTQSFDLPVVPAETLLEQHPTDPVEQLHHLGRCATAAAVHPEPEPYWRRVAECLASEREPIRWAAARAVESRPLALVQAALVEAAARFPELLPVQQRHAALLANAEDGTLYDTDTDQIWTWIDRARDGLEKQQWKRVGICADAVLKQFADHLGALYLRGEAHFGLGERALAAAYVGAFREEQRSQKKAHEDTGTEPDDFSLASPELEAEVEDLRERIGADPVAFAEAEAQLLAWLPEEAGHAAGAAKVLRELTSDVVLDWLVGWYFGEVGSLRRVVDAVPDFAEAWVQLGDRSDAKHLARARELLGQPRSPEAERLYAWVKEPTTEASLVHRAGRKAYDAQKWDEAARLGDELIALDPTSDYGWQLRAQALTFGLRHPEAVTAYREALAFFAREKADASWWGENPVGLMHFNLSCVLAKLGQREEGLDELRYAARIDSKWLEDATSDDYWEAYWEDEEFLAVVDEDPAASVPRAERTPEALERARVLGVSRLYRGETEEAVPYLLQAAGIAAALDQPAAEAKALSLLGRALDDPDEAEDAVQEALEIAQDPRVSVADRAEVVNEWAVFCHGQQRWEEAEEAYREAMELRIAADGEDSRLLGKSYGDLARLSIGRGQPVEEAIAWLDKGIALLNRDLAGRPSLTEVPEDAERLESQADLAHLHWTRAQLRQYLGQIDAAVDDAEALVTCAEQVAAERGSLGAAVEEGTERLLDALGGTSAADRVAGLRVRWNLLSNLSPEERAERSFWRQVRNKVQLLRVQGVPDTAIAAEIKEVLRSGRTEHPELQSLAAEFAVRVQRVSTFLFFTAISLDLAASGGGTLDKALEDLEEIAVGGLWGEE